MLKTTIATLGLLAYTHAHQTISLQARVPPPGSSLKRRSAINVPLTDFFKGTDLQWFGNITVGTPPQLISVVFDTGSTELLIASTLCENCVQTKFDSTRSSTFVDGGAKFNISFNTGVGVDPVNDSDHLFRLILRNATDTVSIGGVGVPDVRVFLITNQTQAFNVDPFSGILGMGSKAVGIFAGLVEQGLPSLFSLYLAPRDVGNAELTLGGTDDSKFSGPPIFTSILPSPQAGVNSWTLSSPSLSVNGKTNSILNQKRVLLFDSGTSNILFSTNTTEAIYALISPDIKPKPDELGAYGIACDKIPELPAVIDVTLISQSGAPFNLTIPSSEFSVGPFENDPSTCQTLINAFDKMDIIGASLFKHWYSIWDVGNQRMGFAPALL